MVVVPVSVETETACAVAASVCFALGMALEVVADAQLAAFVKRKREPGYNGPRVLTTGLWHMSRHPNFIGNTVYWSFGVALLGAQPWGPLAVLATFILFYYLQVRGGRRGGKRAPLATLSQKNPLHLATRSPRLIVRRFPPSSTT